MLRIPQILACLFLFVCLSAEAGEWVQKSSCPHIARHRESAFALGGKVYFGLGHVNSGTHAIYKDIWEYDPASDSWSQKADYGGGLRYHCASFVIDNYAYIGLGHDSMDVYRQDLWRFDPVLNQWQEMSSYPGEERRGASAFVINNLGYVGLGQATSGYKQDFYAYNPSTDAWALADTFPGLPRTHAVSFVYNDEAYLGTGHTYSLALKDFWKYSPTTGQWTQLSDVGDTLRQDASGFCIGDYGYIGTGNDVNGDINYGDFWRYDFTTDTWQEIEEFGGQKRRFMECVVIGNVAYCGGGTNGTNFNDLWAYDPVLSIVNKSSIMLSVYPNPATGGTIQVESSSGIQDVKIYTINGSLMQSHQINSTSKDLDVTNLSPGTYVLMANGLNGHSSQKIIIQ